MTICKTRQSIEIINLKEESKVDNYEYMEKVYKLEQKAFHLDIEGWYQNEIFTCRWWVLLAFLIVPWLIWAKVAFRTKLLESILFGSLIAIITIYLDVLGVKLNFWDYPTQLFPIMPRGISFDMSYGTSCIYDGLPIFY